MAVAEHADPDRPRLKDRLYAWKTGLLRSRRFQRLAARTPVASRIARRDGEALFDLVAGFLHSQVLTAFVELDLADLLAHRPRSAEALALSTGIAPERMRVLCQAAAALGLMTRRADGTYALGRLGAALPGIPGLTQMIRHHDVLYRDMADPVAFFRDAPDTGLAAFWPYVFGATGEIDAETAATYSELMAESQTLVAEEALRVLDLSGIGTLLDIGGGTGAFLSAVGEVYPHARLHLFDLPQVAPAAAARFAARGLADRAAITTGSFRTDSLPTGADAISLIRVLYDHSDATVRMLLAKAHAALPAGGRIIVSEPMSGGDHPRRAGDAYFGLYCLAMGTGRARSAEEIGQALQDAGFVDIRVRRTARAFITSVVEARKP
jgi:demethylspheroidene O-methyltransferase